MSDLLSLLDQIPQAERSSDTGRALARLIAERASAKFDRSHEAQEAVKQFNQEAFSEPAGGQPRNAPFTIPELIQPHEDEYSGADEDVSDQFEQMSEPQDLLTKLHSLHRMRGTGNV